MELKEVTYEVLATGDKMPSGYYLKADVNAVLAEKDKEIAELKAKLEDVNELVKESKELLKESQKMHQRCADNASKQIRRLKRALWLARARRAEARKNYWYARSCHEGDDFLVSIDGSPVKYIGCIKRTNYDWLLTWSEVERKCLNKMEEYK